MVIYQNDSTRQFLYYSSLLDSGLPNLKISEYAQYEPFFTAYYCTVVRTISHEDLSACTGPVHLILNTE